MECGLSNFLVRLWRASRLISTFTLHADMLSAVSFNLGNVYGQCG